VGAPVAISNVGAHITTISEVIDNDNA